MANFRIETFSDSWKPFKIDEKFFAYFILNTVFVLQIFAFLF